MIPGVLNLSVFTELCAAANAVSHVANNSPRQCSQGNRQGFSPHLTFRQSVHMKPQPQKKLARAYRIRGSIVLYRSAPKSPFKSERAPPRAKPWWTFIVGIPLFLRSLFRLVYVCPHRHMGPPITSREAIPSNLRGYRSVVGQGTYITCLDCGQRFAYNSATRRLVDFWGVHNEEALEGVRHRIVDFFSPLRGLAKKAGSLNIKTPISRFVRSVQFWPSHGGRGSARIVSNGSQRPQA
jgi:hypothetical protein